MQCSRLLFVWVLLFFIPAENAAFGQTKSISLELGGSAGLASLNYEKTFREAAQYNLAYRIGLFGFPIDRNTGFVFVLPLAVQARWGAGPHKLETAMGVNLSFTTKAKAFIQAIPAIGYRYQPADKRIFFRLAYTPIVSFLVDWQYQHWGGLSIGYSL